MNQFMTFAGACLLMGSLLMGSMSVVGAPTAVQPDPPYAVARGFANMMGGWLEIPRGIVYENARIPVVGFLSGTLKGSFLTMWREVAGITDVMCMGLTRQGLYSRMVPDFVWDAEWNRLPQRRSLHRLSSRL